MISNPLVSIIMPAYNSDNTIANSIDAVLEQTYKNWELIIINDCSTDSTKEIVSTYAYDERLIIINNEKNKGIAISRNRGISKAKGKYICFLDSDDLWSHNKLEIQVAYMEKENLSFTYTSNNVIDKFGNIIGYYQCPYKLDYKDLLKCNKIHTLTVMIKREIFENIEMPNVKHEDYATWLIILSKGVTAYGIDANLASYRKLQNSKSSNKLRTLNWTFTIYRNILNKNIICSTLYLIRFIFFTLYKYNRIKKLEVNV